MRRARVGIFALIVACAGAAGCARQGSRAKGAQATQPTAAPVAAAVGPNAVQTLHVRLEVRPTDGVVTYLGWYDGRRNLVGENGIVAGLVGVEPPEFSGTLKKVGANELHFRGVDQNQIEWVKTYRVDDHTVHVAYKVTNLRDQAFDAILYSLADLPDARISGDNRVLEIAAPAVQAVFRAEIRDPNFPGEQMNPYAMRSDSKHVEPGESLEFRMTWELRSPRQGAK